MPSARWLLLPSLAMAAPASPKPLEEITDPATFKALVHVPPGRLETPAPLLLYLHGAGESGRNVRELISEGATGTPPVELERGTAASILARKFVMVAPQTDHGWDASEVGRFVDWLLSGKAHNLPTLDRCACVCAIIGYSPAHVSYTQTACLLSPRDAGAGAT